MARRDRTIERRPVGVAEQQSDRHAEKCMISQLMRCLRSLADARQGREYRVTNRRHQRRYTGVTAAHALLRRGFGVTVFERHRCAAIETSSAKRRTTVGQQSRSMEPLCHRSEEFALDADTRRTFAPQSFAVLA
jgi:hypothetical protein